MPILIAFIILFASISFAEEPIEVVLIGDSTTSCTGHPFDHPYRPEVAMQGILGDGYNVTNLAIGASATHQWIDGSHWYCTDIWASWFPIMNHCPEISRFIDGVKLVVPEPDIVLVTLGINDQVYGSTVEETTARLAQIEEELAPALVLFSPPMFVDHNWAGYTWWAQLTWEMAIVGLTDFGHYRYPRKDVVHNNDAGCLMSGARLAELILKLE